MFIFTSPSSSSNIAVNASESLKPPWKSHKRTGERRTHRCIASLIGMKEVTPHAIAYVAVQVHPHLI